MSRHRKVKALDYDEEYDDYYGYDDEDDLNFDEDNFEAKYLSSGIDLSASNKSNNISNINKQTIVDEGNSIKTIVDSHNLVKHQTKFQLSSLDNVDNDVKIIPQTQMNSTSVSTTSLPVVDKIHSTTIKTIEKDDNELISSVNTITSDLTRMAIQHLDKHQWQLPLMEMDKKFRDRTYYKHYTDGYISSLGSKLGSFLADTRLKSNPMRYHLKQELDNYKKYSQMFDLLTEYYQSLGSGFFSFATPSPDEEIVIGCRLGTKVRKPVPKESALAKVEQSTARFEYNGKATTTSGQQQTTKAQSSSQQQKSADKQAKSKQIHNLTVQENFTADHLDKLSKEYNESMKLKDKKDSSKLAQTLSTKLQSKSKQQANTSKKVTLANSSSNDTNPSSLVKSSPQDKQTASSAEKRDQLKPKLATLGERRHQLKQQLKKTASKQPSEKDLETFKVRALQAAKEYDAFIAGSRPRLNLVVVGHVDAGKSTLVGHLLYKLGQISGKQMHRFETDSQRSGKASFKFAWALDETNEERARGVTIDIALTRFETNKNDVVLLDAPGHVDFIPAVISGAAQADAALLVVDATRGEFETGFSAGGQTREHTLLVRSLGVKSLVVVVNKMDNVDWSWTRFGDIVDQLKPFLKQVGFNLQEDVQFVAASGLTGENLLERRQTKLKKLSSHPQLEENSWQNYDSCLIEAIDQMKQPARMVDRPTRLCVTDVYRGVSSGGVFLGGKLVSGKVEAKQRLVLLPPGETCEIKSLEVRDSRASRAFAGDIITTVATGIDLNKYYRGCLLCDPLIPCQVTNRFQARIIMFQSASTILMRGSPVEVHINGTYECGEVRRLISLLNKNTGELLQRRPRCLAPNSSAVVQFTLSRVVCCELYEHNKDLGRFMVRSCGQTIAAGLITKIKSAKLLKSGTKMKTK